ncbi:hypothetical protein BJX61DRAFT_404312 [Aspergillus egyptiacus]|nr:hypothetical protein BJX61DRAFT_404312 [Aspergillus egyptiacus]
MASDTLDRPSLPGNRLIDYVRSLVKAKKGLPYGLPVCVTPSHTVTNTDALIRLASLVGPYISILQVHADIIDDWSEETIRQLTSLAKKYAFLIWESGRILNSTVDLVGRQKLESREVRNELVDLNRKKYTKGRVKPASWANISTAWASGVAVDDQAADILIPALKAAAREAVADTVQTIRTEITAENNSDRLSKSPVHDPISDSDSGHLTSEYAVEESNLEPPPRKASTISLTQTITQHTEDSNNELVETDSYEPKDIWDYGAAPPPPIDTDLPPHPLLARGIVLCLPSSADSSFTSDYRQSCVAAACANQDFVIGFLCGEPWHLVSQHPDKILSLDALTQDLCREEQQMLDDDETRAHSLALFSLISNKLNLQDETPTAALPDPSPFSLNPLARRLYCLVRQALSLRDTFAGQEETSSPKSVSKSIRRPDILHIPVVSLP